MTSDHLLLVNASTPLAPTNLIAASWTRLPDEVKATSHQCYKGGCRPYNGGFLPSTSSPNSSSVREQQRHLHLHPQPCCSYLVQADDMSGRSFTVQDQLAQLTAEVIVESLAMQDRDRELRRRAEANAVRNFSHLHRAREATPRNDRFYYIEDADVSFLDLNDGAPAPEAEPEPEPVEAKAVVKVDSNTSQATIKADPTFIEKMKKVFITTPKKLLQAVTPGSRDSLAAVTTPLEATKGSVSKKGKDCKRRSFPWSSKPSEL
ncbi:hypothetical protein N7488_008090 [Penicillium malachiteum]|nr:hypothetical protein N7488_008090 [Penicillium malachiteum]